MGASGSGGKGKKHEGGKELAGRAADGGHGFRYTEVCGSKSLRRGCGWRVLTRSLICLCAQLCAWG